MDIAQVLLASFNVRVLKEPRGFIKVLQFLFTICSFATTTSFMSVLRLSVTCKDNTSDLVTIPISYSFKLYQMTVSACSGGESVVFRQDFSSDSQFFVAVGVLAFLYTIVALFIYTVFEKVYSSDARVPTADLAFHCIFAILFLAASSAWANSLSGLKSATTIETIIAENPTFCSSNSCAISEEPDFSKLNISVILGFLNVFLFSSNLWFIYKETIFFVGKENADNPIESEPRV
ncbi:UNVERIFIED_CONTAM: hypothetical protein GTU68_044127 [Idotea baltica]|nr:hypothetical protein [Idotea baltica]